MLAYRHKPYFRVICLAVIMAFTFSFVMPREAWAARSNAGGGDIEEWSWEDFALTVVFCIAGTVVGAAVSSVYSDQTLMQSLSSLNTGSFTNGFVTYTASSQVGRAVGAAGAYYGWDRRLTYVLAATASGAAAGFCNPEAITGQTLNGYIAGVLKGIAVGGVTGLASSGVVALIDGKAIEEGEEPGAFAQIMSYVTSVAVGNFMRALVNSSTWDNAKSVGVYVKDGEGNVYALSRDPETGSIVKTKLTPEEQKRFEAYYEANKNNTAVVRDRSGTEVEVVMGTQTAAPGSSGDTSTEKAYIKDWLGNVYEVGKGGERTLLQGEALARFKAAYPEAVLEGIYLRNPDGSVRFVQGKVTGIDQDGVRQIALSVDRTVAPGSGERNAFDARHTANYGTEKKGPDATVKQSPTGVIEISTDAGTGPGLPGATSTSTVGSRLADAALIRTADMWPQIAVKALSILATSGLGKDEKWKAALISSLVEGVATPVLTGAAKYYQLMPGLFVGEDSLYKMADYEKAIKREAYKYRASMEAQKIADLVYPEGPDGERRWIADTDKAHKLLTDAGYDIPKYSEESIMSSVNALDIPQADKDAILADIRKDPVKYMAGMAASYSKAKLGEQFVNTNLDQTLSGLGITRSDLFYQSAKANVVYGLIEGAVTGGASSYAQKLAKNNPMAVALAGYAGVMLSDAIRASIWSATWDNSDGWHKRLTYVADKDTGQFAAREQQAIHETGIKVAEEDLPGGKRNVARLVLSDEKPSWTQGFLYAARESYQRYWNRALSFGNPMAVVPKYYDEKTGTYYRKPEDVTTLMMVDYLQQLRSMQATEAQSPMGAVAVLWSQMTSAASYTIGANMMSSLASIPYTANLFNIQMERIANTLGAPNAPTIRQVADPMAWAMGYHSRLIHPDMGYKTRSTTGSSFIKDY